MSDIALKSGTEPLREGGTEVFVGIATTFVGKDFEYVRQVRTPEEAKQIIAIGREILSQMMSRNMIAPVLSWKAKP